MQIETCKIENVPQEKTALAVFSSMRQFFDYCQHTAENHHDRDVKRHFEESDDWTHYLSGPRFVEEAMKPHADLAFKVDEVSKRFDDLRVEGNKRRRAYSVVGRCVVPRYVANNPLPMARTIVEKRDNSPLTVVVNTGATWNIKAEDMLGMSIYTTALVKLLSMRRAVRLFVYCALSRDVKGGQFDYVGVAFPLNVTPFDSPRVSFIMSHPSIFRTCFQTAVYGVSNVGKGDGLPFPFDKYLGNPNKHMTWEPYLDFLKQRFAKGGDLLYLSAKLSSSPHWQAYKANPEQWVRDMVAQYGG